MNYLGHKFNEHDLSEADEITNEFCKLSQNNLDNKLQTGKSILKANPLFQNTKLLPNFNH